MKDMSDILRDNAFLFGITIVGGIILGIGYAPPYYDMLVALGAAFIIAGGVGIYMMLATRQVAKKLHQRFNEQNDLLKRLDESSGKQTDILKMMDGSLKEIASSQKEIASSQKEIASSQTQNHTEMIDVLKKIENKL